MSARSYSDAIDALNSLHPSADRLRELVVPEMLDNLRRIGHIVSRALVLGCANWWLQPAIPRQMISTGSTSYTSLAQKERAQHPPSRILFYAMQNLSGKSVSYSVYPIHCVF